MIHRARFQNFKALKDVEVTFDSRLTVLVGPNGSGKSSVLKGIYWLCQMAGDVQKFNQGVQSIMGIVKDTYSGQTEDQLFEVIGKTHKGDAGIRFRTQPDSRKTYPAKIGHNTLPAQNWLCESLLSSSMTPVYPQAIATSPVPFAPAELVELNAGRLAKPSLTSTTPPPVGSDGSGLASLMAYFKLYDEPRFDQVVELFRKIIPRVQRIRIDRVPVAGQQGAMGEGLVFDLPGRKGAPAASMSDGTLYALGLIVKILDPQRPKTLDSLRNSWG